MLSYDFPLFCVLSLVNEIKAPFISVIASTQSYLLVKSISLKDIVLRGGVTQVSHIRIN